MRSEVAKPGNQTRAASRREAALERQIADMRDLLQLMRGASAAESLRALRSAFPDTTLAARAAAIADRRL